MSCHKYPASVRMARYVQDVEVGYVNFAPWLCVLAHVVAETHSPYSPAAPRGSTRIWINFVAHGRGVYTRRTELIRSSMSTPLPVKRPLRRVPSRVRRCPSPELRQVSGGSPDDAPCTGRRCRICKLRSAAVRTRSRRQHQVLLRERGSPACRGAGHSRKNSQTHCQTVGTQRAHGVGPSRPQLATVTVTVPCRRPRGTPPVTVTFVTACGCGQDGG